MARTTVGEVRKQLATAKKTIERLELELQLERVENKRARRYIDATMAGIMTAAGVVQWLERLRGAFDLFATRFERVAMEGTQEVDALNNWIAQAMALKGPKAGDRGSDPPV